MDPKFLAGTSGKYLGTTPSFDDLGEGRQLPSFELPESSGYPSQKKHDNGNSTMNEDVGILLKHLDVPVCHVSFREGNPPTFMILHETNPNPTLYPTTMELRFSGAATWHRGPTSERVPGGWNAKKKLQEQPRHEMVIIIHLPFLACFELWV